MQLSEVRDIVREHFGRLGLPTSVLNVALKEGRRLVEKEGNWWWMRDTKTFNLTAATQDYPLQSGTINEANFKDVRALYWKKSTQVQWESLDVGIYSHEDLDLMYHTDDEGAPECAVIDNATLLIYPIPDDAFTYNMKLWFWQWTTNPTAYNGTDDLLNFHGMALVYAALIWGYEIELKDLQSATYWRHLLYGNAANKTPGAIQAIRRENLKREWVDRVALVPRTGSRTGYGRRLENMQIYKR